MKNIVLKLLLYLSAISIVAQTTDWVRVGPKGFAMKLPATQNEYERYTSSRVNIVRYSKLPTDVDPTIFVMTYHGIFKTTNKGDNFTPIASFNNSSWSTNTGTLVNDFKFTDFIVDQTNPKLLIGASINTHSIRELLPSVNNELNNDLTRKTLIYRTLDEGANWTLINTGLNVNVTKVYKFLFSKDSSSLLACTNYGLWVCSNYKSTTTTPTWALVDFPPENDYMNVVDAVFDNNAGTDYEMYVSADNTIYKKTFKSNVLSAWSDIGASLIPSFSSNKNTFYLAYTKNTLIVKGLDSVYYKNTQHKNLVSQDVCGSLYLSCFGDPKPYYKLYKYYSSTSAWDLINFMNYTFPYGYSMDYTNYMVAHGDYFYIGQELLRRIPVNFDQTTPITDVSIYSNEYCSANHADIMAMAINPSTNEMYVGNHGGFSIFNLYASNDLMCDRWNDIKNEGLPGAPMSSAVSSPFANGELVYNIWDHNLRFIYQIGDKHYCLPGGYESGAPNFYIANKTFVATQAQYNNKQFFANKSYFDESGVRGWIYNFDKFNDGVVSANLDYVRQLKLVQPIKEYNYFYITDTKLYYVNGFIPDNKTFNKQLKLDVTSNSSFLDYKIISLNLTNDNVIYLSLTKGTQSNLLIKSTDMGNTWSNVNLPSNIANLSVGGSYAEKWLAKPVEVSIHKVVFDPFNKNKFYLVMGSSWPWHNMCSIYLTENSGANWTPVFYMYADIVAPASSDGYSSTGSTRPLFPNNYLNGLKVNSDGIIWSRFEDFDVNPNTGDPILVGEDGLYYKKDGFFSNFKWARYYNKNQPRNSTFIDINTSFNKIYVAGNGGVFCADLPCFNEVADLNLVQYDDNKLYQTSGKITCNNQNASSNTNYFYSGKSITFTAGFKYFPNAGESLTAKVNACVNSNMPYKNERDYPIELIKVSSFRIGEEDKEEKNEGSDIDINVYPNPTEGKSKIDLSKLKEMPLKISLVDAKGILLKEYDELEYLDEIDLTKYPTGTYLLKIEFKDSIKVKKIVRFVPTNMEPKAVKNK